MAVRQLTAIAISRPSPGTRWISQSYFPTGQTRWKLTSVTRFRPFSAIRFASRPQYQTYRTHRPSLAYSQMRFLASNASKGPKPSSEDAISEFVSDAASSKPSEPPSTSASSSTYKSAESPATSTTPSSASNQPNGPVADWEDNPDLNISHFSELPHSNFGVNQHMVINDEFKEALRRILWEFKAPIRYAFAYGSGVFPQSKPTLSSSTTTSIHAKAPEAVVKAQGGTPKMIDFIFGVSFTEHWHSLNLRQHRDHYSAVGAGPFGTWQVSKIQDGWGAGAYFNPYITVNGILIKYGVVNLDTLYTDLSEWNTLYIAGRLHKPVKILRDDPRVRYANQLNLIAALRTALLLLPPTFTEQELYGTIANISYMGDPRMSLPTEDPGKVANIVGNNVSHFRRLYGPLIEDLVNVEFDDPACTEKGWMTNPDANVRLAQDMDPIKRGNMVRRLPKTFRAKLYFQYQKKFQIPQLEFNEMMENSTNQGGGFEQRIARAPEEDLRSELRGIIKKTVWWPSTMQSIKGVVTSGFSRSIRYIGEKRAKSREGTKRAKDAALENSNKIDSKKSGEDAAAAEKKGEEVKRVNDGAMAKEKEEEKAKPD